VIVMPRTTAIALSLLMIAAVAAAEQPAATPLPTSPSVPPEHVSARATMRSFIEAFYAEPGPDLERAVACLDLSGLPVEVRGLKGRELAVRIKEVVDRTRLVDFDEIPDAREGPPYVFLRQSEGEVVIDRKESGEWLFSSATVATVEKLHRVLEQRGVVAGVERQAPGAVSTGMWLRDRMPNALRGEFLFLELWQWLGLLVIILIGVVIGRLFVLMGSHGLRRLLARRQRLVDGDVLVRALGPVGALVMLLVWGLGIAWLGLPVSVFRLYYTAVRAVAIVVVVVVAYRLVDVLSNVLSRRAERSDTRFDDLLVPLVRKSLKVFVVAIGLVLVAETIGQDITALLAGLGLGGLALALAAQDTVRNLFGSLTILLDRPFQVGDWVVVGEVEGTVEEVGFRSTRIRTFYNSLITLPNANLISASVDNLGDRRYRRWKTILALTYDTPPEKIDAFCEGVRELIRSHPYSRKDYFHVYFNDFGGASLDILLYTFFETPDWATELRERHRLGVDILRLAGELGVEFAFSTQTVYLRNEEWSLPQTAGPDYAEASERLMRGARAEARRLIEDSVGDELPPPVSFDVPPEENRGESEE
jgi:MscS family membrane protein